MTKTGEGGKVAEALSRERASERIRVVSSREIGERAGGGARGASGR